MRRDASAKLVRGGSTFVVSPTKAKDGAFAKIRPSQARREGAGGQLAGGKQFSRGALYLMLQNRIYSGEIVHQGVPYPTLASTGLSSIRSFGGSCRTGSRPIAMTAHWGLGRRGQACWIVDAEGERMTPTHATKGAKRYRYYVSASLLAGDRQQSQRAMRVPAGDIEGLTLDRLQLFFSSRTEVGDALAPLDLDARILDAALRAAFELSQ
jgi:site-specific DNA recombinase